MGKIPASPLIAGIDIGGTNTRCAVALREAPEHILHRTSTPTPGPGVALVLDVIAQEVALCCREAGVAPERVSAAGCAAPGMTNSARGVVVDAANLIGWTNAPLGRLLGNRLGVPVTIANDVNAAALAEATHGAGSHCGSIVYMTISTGVAAGIVIDGRLVHGAHHSAGEIGCFVPDPMHLDRDWKPNGCLEMTSAGIGLGTAWAALRGGLAEADRAVEVFEAARHGDADALALIQRAADYLAQAAVAIGCIIDPDRIVLGGSIARHSEEIAGRIEEVLHGSLPFPPDVVHASLGGDAPLVGALMLAARSAASGL